VVGGLLRLNAVKSGLQAMGKRGKMTASWKLKAKNREPGSKLTGRVLGWGFPRI